MPRRINQPLQFFNDPPMPFSAPRRFFWRGCEHIISSLSGEWRKLGRWWACEPERRYLRAVTVAGLTFELCQDMTTGQWTLVGLQD